MAQAAGIPDTLARLPFFVSRQFDSAQLIGVCRADGVDFISHTVFLERVHALAEGLLSIGVARGAHVAILAESRPEWLLVDLAILTLGAVTVPLYPTLSATQVEVLLRDSGAEVVVASTSTQCDKVAGAGSRLPQLRTLILMSSPVPEDGASRTDVTCLSLRDVEARGAARIAASPSARVGFEARANEVKPDDLATIIYTSGSSGEPKGVMLTHANIAANLRDVPEVLTLSTQDVALSFLPLCHAFERTVAYVYLTHGVSLVFAESIDTLARDMMLARPTVMSGVPRVFEKLLDRILEGGRAQRGITRHLFTLAMAVARARGRTVPNGEPAPWWATLLLPVVRSLVFSKILHRVGGRLRFAVSGSAPLREDVARLFFGMGLPIAEGYGLTETAPVLTVNRPTALRFGTVGPPLPSVQLRIADDGEILAKGPNIMAGYYKRPDLTAEVMHDGWFSTGDIGAIDANGALRITDRKKELLVTSGGKKVAPQPIEAALRGAPVIAEAVVIGDGRRFPAALILPRWSALAAALDQPVPSDAAGRQLLATSPAARAAIQRAINDVNEPLANFERIKAFAIICDEFSVAGGELTPTLKVKRRVIDARYASVIAALYA